jgi:hypothetical protein
VRTKKRKNTFFDRNNGEKFQLPNEKLLAQIHGLNSAEHSRVTTSNQGSNYVLRNVTQIFHLDKVSASSGSAFSAKTTHKDLLMTQNSHVSP